MNEFIWKKLPVYIEEFKDIIAYVIKWWKSSWQLLKIFLTEKNTEFLAPSFFDTRDLMMIF